jgi:alpha/beta superfamily hydrolase
MVAIGYRVGVSSSKLTSGTGMVFKMTEERVFVSSGEVKLEVLMDEAPGERAAVITHPHPLYGGDMHNPVVLSVAEAYREQGFTTLRFNFRGVGQSEGIYQQGVGEQEDVAAILGFASQMGKTHVDLAGYSFGAWVNALGLKNFVPAKRMVMVSPPVGFLDFSFLKYDSRIQLVIAASQDEIGPPDQIKSMLTVWNPEARLEIIQGADHFYWGHTAEIKGILKDFLGSRV